MSMRIDEWVGAAAETSPLALGAAAAAALVLVGTRRGRSAVQTGARAAARAALRTQDMLWHQASRAHRSWSQLMAEARAAAPAVDVIVGPGPAGGDAR